MRAEVTHVDFERRIVSSQSDAVTCRSCRPITSSSLSAAPHATTLYRAQLHDVSTSAVRDRI